MFRATLFTKSDGEWQLMWRAAYNGAIAGAATGLAIGWSSEILTHDPQCPGPLHCSALSAMNAPI